MGARHEKAVGIERSWMQGEIEAQAVERWDKERECGRNVRNVVGRNHGM